jgi:hypothetical protein
MTALQQLINRDPARTVLERLSGAVSLFFQRSPCFNMLPSKGRKTWMRTRMLAACLTFALTACGTEPLDPSAGEAKVDATHLGSTQDIQAALAAFPSTQVLGTHENGVPYMVRGNFGSTDLSPRGHRCGTSGCAAKEASSSAAVTGRVSCRTRRCGSRLPR